MQTYITSDNHFYHYAIIRHASRPFRTVQEMNQYMIEGWRGIVSNHDLVIHLGDFAPFKWKKAIMSIKKQLTGTIILILGNHDSARRMRKCGFTVTKEPLIIDNIIMTHRPMRFVPKGFVNLHGHIHHRQWNGNRINCCVEHTNYEPVNIEKYFKQADKILEKSK